MAFIATTGTPLGGRKFYLNVSYSVGAGGKNYWTDIMAVQFLIRKVYLDDYENRWTKPISLAERIDIPDPFEHFKELKKTERWIRRFQKDSNHKVIDGRVNRAEGHMYRDGNGDRFIIWKLNEVYSDVSGYNGTMENVLNWSTIPPLLKAELAKYISSQNIFG